MFERLSKHDVFGRMSFTTGLPRATEAHTSRDTRLLIIPREAFLGLLADSADLRSLAAERVRDKEVVTFLKHRHGLSDDHVSEWQDCGP